MKVNSVSNYQIFKQKTTDLIMEKSVEQASLDKEPKKKDSSLGKAVFYSTVTALGALVGSLHGIYKKTCFKENLYNFYIEAGEDEKIKLLVEKIGESIERIKVGIRLANKQNPHTHHGHKEEWKIIEELYHIVEKDFVNRYRLLEEIVPGKKQKIKSIEDIKELSFFKKIINPGEATLLEKMSRIKLLEKPINFYNKSDNVLRQVGIKSNRNLYYNKQLLQKGMVACGALTLLLVIGIDKLTSKIMKESRLKKENENNINK